MHNSLMWCESHESFYSIIYWLYIYGHTVAQMNNHYTSVRYNMPIQMSHSEQISTSH